MDKKILTLEGFKKIEKQIKQKRNECNNYIKNKEKEINDNIDLDFLKTLSYEELNEFYDLYCKYGSFKLVDGIYDILEEKKVEKYPLLSKAYYYPILNELDITDEEKRNIDEYLYNYYKINKPKETFHIMLDNCLKENENKIHDIFNFLLNNKIIEKVYIFSCNCFSPCYEKIITEKQKEKFYNYHCFDYDNATEEEINKHEDDYIDGYIYIDCDNDYCIEIDSIESFEKNAKVLYQVILEPDTSLDEV